MNSARPATVVPLPVSVTAADAPAFALTPTSRIVTNNDGPLAVGEHLASGLRTLTGFALPLSVEPARAGDISLNLAAGEAPAGHRDEGYTLVVDEGGVRIGADTAAGLFWGTQSLTQLFAAAATTWAVPAMTIVDYPRYAYRGAMLDVARHFFSVDVIKRYLDELSLLKVNHLHLHLTDDQGWRIEITAGPISPPSEPEPK